MSVIASAVMLSSTIGFASAATFPAPFDTGSAIVYGAAGNVQVDMAAAINIQTAIGQVSGSGAVGIPEGSWQVKTSSDDLEINESISQVSTSIDKDNLPILADGAISNEKGTAKYTQNFYFSDASTSKVTYANDGDDIVGLFYEIDSSNYIANYSMDFTTNLKTDVTSASVLDDIQDKEISMLGKTYVITNAVNTTATNVQLTLMSGADKVTIANGEELTVGGKTISVLVSSSSSAQFTIDGEQTSKLAKGDTTKLNDGTYLGVSDITYQDFSGGLMQATVYVGADKIQLDNDASMVVNADTVSYAKVLITATQAAGDISISQIRIAMTAEDNLYVPVNGVLSEAENLDRPQVLVTGNWDIAFNGLDSSTKYDELSLDRSTDSKMKIKFNNYDGDVIDLPLVYSNATGIFAGEKAGYDLILNASDNITKNDYFILNTANPTTASNNARSYVVQYKGADKSTDTDPKMKFNIIGVDSAADVTLSSAGAGVLKIKGTSFTFQNTTTATSSDCNIMLTSAGDYSTGMINSSTSVSNYVRTRYNELINITDINSTTATSWAGAINLASQAWNISLVVDDTNRDGDKYTASAGNYIFSVKLLNNSDGEIATTVASTTNGVSWVSDPNDNTRQTYIDSYGNEITYNNPSGSPGTITVKTPDSIVKPLVYVTSGAISAGSTGTGGLALIVDDSKIDTVKDKNLVVVGGSCINKVAAMIIAGSEAPLCAEAWTAKTQAGPSKYIIKTVVNPYAAADSGKVAMLVAGYEAADTANAASKVAEKTISTEVGTSQVYPIVGTA